MLSIFWDVQEFFCPNLFLSETCPKCFFATSSKYFLDKPVQIIFLHKPVQSERPQLQSFSLVGCQCLNTLGGGGWGSHRIDQSYRIKSLTKILHYAFFGKKRGKKCTSLDYYFSRDFHRKIVKFDTKLS